MKILITGANGFVGSHLARYLSERDQELYLMVRKTSDLTLLKKLNPNFNKFHLVYGDVTDIDSLRRNIKGMDVVINLAGVLKGLNQNTYNKVNVYGVLNVCKAALEVNPEIKRIIFTSSIAGAAAGNPNMVTEDDKPKYIKGDRYGISKYLMEKALKKYMGKSKGDNSGKPILPIVIIRPPIILGAGDVPSLDLYKLPKIGLKLVIGNKPLFFSIVDVEDLCSGIWECCINDKAIGETFYFTTGKPIEWGALQELLGYVVFGKKYGSLLTISIPARLLLT
ncbi:MAG: NAD-dependent epimerase/dehydratase family protein, partial [Promethearchaeota archaeon]